MKISTAMRTLLLAATFSFAVILWADSSEHLALAYGKRHYDNHLNYHAGPMRGQIFLYGLKLPDKDIYPDDYGTLFYMMPMSSIVSALLSYHTPDWLLPPVLLLAGLAPLILVFNLGRLLQSNACGLAAVGLSLSLVPERMEGDTLIYVIMLLIAANLIVWRTREPNPWRGAWVGLAVGIGLLLRSPLFLFPVILCAYEWISRSSELRERRWKSLIPLLAFSWLVLAPWVYTQQVLLGRWTPLESGRADSPIVTGALGLVSTIEGDFRKLAAMTERDGPLLWAVGEVLSHPLRFINAYFVRAGHVVAMHPWLFLFGVVALWTRRRREDYRQLGLLVFYFIGIHCLMSVVARFFVPIWPLFAVLAASALTDPLRLRVRPPETARMGLVWACFAPGLILGLFTLGSVGSYSSRIATGGDNLEDALQKHRNDPWLWAERGRRRLAAGDAKGAVQDYSRGLLLEPTREMAVAYARALWARGGRSVDFIFHVPFKERPRSEEYPLKMFVCLQRGKMKDARLYLRLTKKWLLDEIHASDFNEDFDEAGTGRLRSVDINAAAPVILDFLRLLPVHEQSALKPRLVQLALLEGNEPELARLMAPRGGISGRRD
ncbi:MAG: hypothetical protein COV48_09835 [Elusimicrobia bacterium CG11_big_fil_rev_8_21_14_0_20_64_6]|nr:MAG: hypothetical protein COV48_09835 [Elusimicrobia bacterium CG11_big_fil_rev_8_21_14_0_20_64_6]